MFGLIGDDRHHPGAEILVSGQGADEAGEGGCGGCRLLSGTATEFIEDLVIGEGKRSAGAHDSFG